jgi:hypothetical protein
LKRVKKKFKSIIDKNNKVLYGNMIFFSYIITIIVPSAAATTASSAAAATATKTTTSASTVVVTRQNYPELNLFLFCFISFHS